jgi:hypothetical protein
MFLAAALLAAACGSEAEGPCELEAAVGDLVITELMINPVGLDEGYEWIEIYNASDGERCLNGLLLEVTVGMVAQHFVRPDDSLLLPAGSYALLGAAVVADTTYSWGTSLALPNGKGTIALKQADTVIDMAPFGGEAGEIEEGRSLALCSECRADLCNDSPDLWRPSSDQPYDPPGNRGSPGIPNGSCLCPVVEGVSSMRKPQPGDLVITEIFANPVGQEGEREWFEIRVVAQDAGLDLSGMAISLAQGGELLATVDPSLCLTGVPDDYMVFGRSAAKAANGGIEVDYAYGQAVTLPNDVGQIVLSMDGVVLTWADYSYTTEGKSRQYDETAKKWCDAAKPFGSEQALGTPGEPNTSCDHEQVLCKKGGEMIQAATPFAGELQITEIFANTPGNEVPEMQWFEVKATGSREIDLNHLQLWDQANAPVPAAVLEPESEECLRLAPGGIVVLARMLGKEVNGVSEGSVLAVYPATLLLKPAGYLAIRSKGETIDSHEWKEAEDGHSIQKDPGSGDWCSSEDQFWSTPGGKPAYGTPGMINSPCKKAPTCLEAGVPRPANLPLAGELVITEMFANPAGNDSPNREWLEIYAASSAIGKDVNGISMVVKGEAKGVLGIEGGDCVVLKDGRLVVGKTTNTEANGGVAVDIALPDFILPNSEANVSLVREQVLYDTVYYDDPPESAALQLDPASTSKDANDDPENWCAAKTPYGPGADMGTPGEENPPCEAEFCTAADGKAHVLVKPLPNELVISEVYANPDGDDGVKEWFEVYVVPTAQPAHLNGVGIMEDVGSPPKVLIQSPTCIDLVPGSYLVLCDSKDTSKNGGVEGCLEYEGITLKNKNGFLGLGLPGIIYDTVPDTGVAKDGVSRSLDPAHLTADGNDSTNAWCDTPAGHTFTDGLGTPAAKNPDCP